MILIVGHGPSADVDPEWVDSQDFVVRLFTNPRHHPRGTYVPTVGTKVDVIVTTRPRNIFDGPNWWLESDYRDMCRELADPYTDRKLSTGTVACLIANHICEDEIGVIGFDTTMRGIYYNKWPYHDALKEGELLRSIGVKDYGKDV